MRGKNMFLILSWIVPIKALLNVKNFLRWCHRERFYVKCVTSVWKKRILMLWFTKLSTVGSKSKPGDIVQILAARMYDSICVPSVCLQRCKQSSSDSQNGFLHEKCVPCHTTGYLFCQFNVIRELKAPHHKPWSFSLYLSFSYFILPIKMSAQGKEKIMSEMTLQTQARSKKTPFSYLIESRRPDEGLSRKRTWKHGLIRRV